MATLYFLTLLPLVIGAFLWIKNKKIVLWEWLAATGVGLVTVILMHSIIYHSIVADECIVSGQLTKTTFHPAWTELYYVTVCETHGSGKDSYTTCHQEPRTSYHSEYWDVDSNIGDTHDIEQEFYNKIVQNFGRVKQAVDDSRGGLISGDPNVYVTTNKTGFIYPIIGHRYWENPVKASKSLFKYGKPPKSIENKLFPYPKNEHWTRSDRLLGRAKQDFDLLEFDRLNAVLGPMKKVNIIIVGFGPDTDEQIGEYQEVAWQGGKKNDLVITYGGQDNSKWVHVFSWTEADILKSNLESLFLSNKISDNLFPEIKNQVIQYYKLKDWSKFNYLSVETPDWAWVVVLLVMILTQFGFWSYAFHNDIDKEE